MESPSAITSLFSRLEEVLGKGRVLSDPTELAAYCQNYQGTKKGSCQLVARPSSTEQVAAVLSICHDRHIAVTPRGGNTGLVGGTVPNGGIVLDTTRLNRIREMDLLNATMTVEAGVILADVQSAARQAGVFFPLSLGAEGSCRIGGNLATNAGGTAVLRYGNIRQLTLGLEVVLPDGQIWNGLRSLHKDNTGYDLKNLFIGSEGTLGVITAAVLKLFPMPVDWVTGLVAFTSIDTALSFFVTLRGYAGDALSAFELMDGESLALASHHGLHLVAPFDRQHPCYALVELSGYLGSQDVQSLLMKPLESGLEDGSLIDAVVANSLQQAKNLWALREGIVAGLAAEGLRFSYDISIPISSISKFIPRAASRIASVSSHIRTISFGHVGDGNVHFVLLPAVDLAAEIFLSYKEKCDDCIFRTSHDFGGSFSAEHGVGTDKRDAMSRYKPSLEIALMRQIKNSLDPLGIMNPGKVLPDEA
ncbi:MAG TPA: FAD-binding oxidoreductase [Gammaproteobacteria bacterium]|nr:FAD-binding oxidoreductase [Gammaproteobacteria bacterium]